MTRTELIQVIEKDIGELTADLQSRKQALTLLRSAGTPPRNGPIVYGNKAAKKRGSSPASRALQGATIQARALIKEWLEAATEGLTTSEMKERLKAAHIQITDSTIHNALRALNPVKIGVVSGSRNSRYALQ